MHFTQKLKPTLFTYASTKLVGQMSIFRLTLSVHKFRLTGNMQLMQYRPQQLFLLPAQQYAQVRRIPFMDHTKYRLNASANQSR